MEPQFSASNKERLSVESVPPSTQMLPNKIVAVSHGIELYNLKSERQISYFTIFNQQENQWLTYQLPMLQGTSISPYLSADETLESCPQAGMPLILPNGTIYIAAAGGILNRLTPTSDGNYHHSYAILGQDLKTSEPLTFTDNPVSAHLIAQGDKPLSHPMIKETVTTEQEGVTTLNERTVSFFQSYEDSKHPLVERPVFNMLVKQGLQTQKEHEKLWLKQREGQPSLKAGMEELASLPDNQKMSHPLFATLAKKDGPSKEETKIIWNREATKLPKKTDILTAVGHLRKGLEQEWNSLLKEKDGKCKFKPETMPLYKVRMATIPGGNNKAVVAVMGHLYQLDDNDASLTPLGKLPLEAERVVDCTGIVALNNSTFILGDMGIEETMNGPKTLQVVKINDYGQLEVDTTLTGELLSALSPLWRGNGTPRIKSIAATSSASGVTSLFIRTKHAGNDVVQADITLKEGHLDILTVQPLSLTDTYNNEYLTACENRLFSSVETEDYMRSFNLFTRAKVTALEDTHINCYMTGSKASSSAPQHPAHVAPPLPAFIPYTGYGLSGIYITT